MSCKVDTKIRSVGLSSPFDALTLHLIFPSLVVLDVLFARALSDRLSDKRIIVNTVNPGYCYSNIRSGFTGLQAWTDWLMEKALARTSEQGSRQLVWAAVGGKDQLDQMRGAYISRAQVSEASDFVISEEGKACQDKLWVSLFFVIQNDGFSTSRRSRTTLLVNWLKSIRRFRKSWKNT